MSILYIHVGHGKTGSSYIQSSLALSADSLGELGLIYPEAGSTNNAKAGKITSGNGSLLHDVGNFEICNERNFLLSSEVLFHEIIEGKLDYFFSNISNSNFELVKILLFIRDPVEHASSSYQQRVKRGGSSIALEDMFEIYNQPLLVKEFIRKIEGCEKASTTVYNYSTCKNDLLGVVSKWIGIEAGVLKEPPVKNVNRSLTRAELRFQSAVNKVLGPSGGVVSDPLCNSLPEIRADRILPSVDVQKAMLDRLANEINFVNEFVEPGHVYNHEAIFDSGLFSETELFSFSGAQIDTVATAMAVTIKKLRRQASSRSSEGPNKQRVDSNSSEAELVK